MPLLSAQKLAWSLGIPLSQLRKIAANIDDHYRVRVETDDRKGKTRTFMVPNRELKEVQRRILRNVLETRPSRAAAHGGMKERSPGTNAGRHLGKELLVNIDLRDFFPSVDHRSVSQMFRQEFGCGRETTWLLTRLTTYRGQLPQGVPTSTMVANLLLKESVDAPLEQLALANMVEYTRFVDDMSYSGRNARALINHAARFASRIGLQTWRSSSRNKMSITPRWQRQEVTGLTVNAKNGPSVGRYRRDRIRSAIHQLRHAEKEKLGILTQSILGRIAHVQQYNPGSAYKLRRHLDRVLSALAD